jgi:hypothetical protein
MVGMLKPVILGRTAICASRRSATRNLSGKEGSQERRGRAFDSCDLLAFYDLSSGPALQTWSVFRKADEWRRACDLCDSVPFDHGALQARDPGLV